MFVSPMQTDGFDRAAKAFRELTSTMLSLTPKERKRVFPWFTNTDSWDADHEYHLKEAERRKELGR